MPEANHNRQVATWLLACCVLVFMMVVLGGVTRLTGSGLSMAEWRPIMGAIPPLSDAEWQRVFEIYQQTPEFKLVNSHMGVDDFKGIFWLEYLHRLLGRVIGIAFAVPLAWFAIRGAIKPRQLPWYLFLLALGGAQAFIGKIMVASGQVDAPQVSHFKLTAHLGAAFLVYALMFWTALNLIFKPSGATNHRGYRWAVAVTVLVSITVLSGGFVAGLDAGRIYNMFPLMGEGLVPPGLMALEPAWRNPFYNLTTVQFDHRVLAITTLILAVVAWFRLGPDLPARARLPRHGLLVAVLAQVTLGIMTLLYVVPTTLAAAHQAVALVLLTIALYLAHSLRKIPM
ncbi:MAG: COX15/CtaA family protein [Woeseiaceae bacterium]|nr:COX15/CtaA family protein [Woeseiaceae bacterium]